MLPDHLLGFLLRISLKMDKPFKGEIKHSLYYNEQISSNDRFELSLLNKEEGFPTVKSNLSPLTLITARATNEAIKQKLGALVSPAYTPDGIKSLYEEGMNLSKFTVYLMKKYGYTKDIDFEDLKRVLTSYKQIQNTLYFTLIFSANQIHLLCKHLKNYSSQYQSRDLGGQEKFALPQIYAQGVLDYINDSGFLKLYGIKRVSIQGEGRIFFCHSLFYLQEKGLIKILDLKSQNTRIVSATIDNLSQAEQKTGNEPSKMFVQKTSGDKIEWLESFHWKENTFLFGDYGDITFKSNERKKLFKTLADRKGDWATVKKLEETTGKNENFIRATIRQIEERFEPNLKRHISIPSTQEDKTIDPPPQGAYRIKFTP